MTDDPTASLEDELDEFREEPAADAVPLVVPFDAADDPNDLAEEQALLTQENADIPKQPEPAGFTPHPALDEDPYRNLHGRIEEKFTKQYNEQTVTVSEEERRRFLRAALHGEPLWFDVEFPALGTSVRVVPAPPQWTDSAASAARGWQKSGRIDDNFDSWLDNFQMLLIWLQVDRVNGEPMPWFQAALEIDPTASGFRKMKELLDEESTIDVIRQLNAAQRYMIISAVRIAEIRNCLCMDALSDGSFFSPAGTN